ncbi:Alpha-D-phosphohexomutase, alpha/beta/alpha domain I [Artemisia annua]|uniref:Alpha-D-phosphohexomutase, alpha/beta/alpha domain I n=1 Tax=Artemisia annua TaxID=35608 RepID=A0A2U1PKV0_ARTAN|nr:Alpha-D-phosphohexomutase, alpha/beta/alpha domain I [Artemisia annua]
MMEPCLDAWYFTKSRDQVKVHHPNVTEVLRHLQHAIPSLVELEIVMKLGSTSGIFNSTLSKHEDFLCPVDGAIMITCNTSTPSHLPYNITGFKFITNVEGYGKAGIKHLKEVGRKPSSSINIIGYMSLYASDLIAAIRKASGNIGIVDYTASVLINACPTVTAHEYCTPMLWSISTVPPVYDAHQSPNLEDDEHNSSRQQNNFYVDCGNDCQLYIQDKNSSRETGNSVSGGADLDKEEIVEDASEIKQIGVNGATETANLVRRV